MLTGSDIDTAVAEVAAAVGLAEGESGIRDILAAVLSAEPAAVRDVARLAELPVPIVAAACNELRRRGVVDSQRPVRLTAAGRVAVAAAAGGPPLRTACPRRCNAARTARQVRRPTSIRPIARWRPRSAGCCGWRTRMRWPASASC